MLGRCGLLQRSLAASGFYSPLLCDLKQMPPAPAHGDPLCLVSSVSPGRQQCQAPSKCLRRSALGGTPWEEALESLLTLEVALEIVYLAPLYFTRKYRGSERSHSKLAEELEPNAALPAQQLPPQH